MSIPAIHGKKVHVTTGHSNSLCGLSPRNGTYRIHSFSKFFTAADEVQCEKCLEAVKRRGYNIAKLRAQFRHTGQIADKLAREQRQTSRANIDMRPFFQQAKAICQQHQGR